MPKNRSNFTSFTFQMGVKVKASKIYLPKLGWMRFFNSRVIPDGFTIKAATIRKRQDGWYVSVRIEDKTIPDYVQKPLNEVNSILGCDLGLNTLAKNAEIVDTPISQTVMARSSFAPSVDIMNTLTLVLQKQSEIEVWK